MLETARAPDSDLLLPADEADLATIIAEAAARRAPLAVVGANTKAGLGRPVQAEATLSARGLTGVTLHEPAELVIAARAGTPLAEIEALLASCGQRLPFEPPDWRGVFGAPGEPTIAAAAAANLSGPRRPQVGAARDGLIGVRAVTGRGEVVKSGGRVMKNVTGLDLVKGLAGSWGTLAVFSEVTFKVLPMPETETTLVFRGLSAERAVALMAAALSSPFEVSGAAHDPHAGGGPATVVRLEGFAASVADRSRRLPAHIAASAPAEVLAAEASRAIWRGIRNLDAFALAARDLPTGEAGRGVRPAPAPGRAAGRLTTPGAETAPPLWRVSLRPTDAPAIAAAAHGAFPTRVLYEWGGALLWIAVGADLPDAGAAIIRSALAATGNGHATLFRAPTAARNAVPVFQPLAPAVMDLTRRVKASFDPAGVLNPGRMYAGL